MSIKNWTVVTERVKGGAGGLQTYQSYLNAKSHKNHRNTEILPVTDNASEFFASSAKNSMQKDADNTKGGRPVASYAQGFNLTLPHEFQPTHAQWKMIFLKVREDLKKHLDCDNTCFYANVHKEPKKNSHLNLLVSRCYNAKVLDKLDQRSTLSLTKNSFTKAVLEVCKISTDMYEKKSNKKTSKRLSNNDYSYKKKKEQEALLKANAEKNKIAIASKANLAFSEIISSCSSIAPMPKDELIQLNIQTPKQEQNQKTIDKKFKMR